jgi:hypothetical protein
MFRWLLMAPAAAALFLASVANAAALPNGGVVILEGRFGTLGARAYLDITARLHELCVPGSERCDIFCSETSFGRYALGKRPICRVTYRCPDLSTRSVEAAREEMIFLRCGEAMPEAEPQDRTAAPGSL